jgi:outer-membrane receptor for ferric coprogen and ferric-rhodotorulic acid
MPHRATLLSQSTFPLRSKWITLPKNIYERFGKNGSFLGLQRPWKIFSLLGLIRFDVPGNVNTGGRWCRAGILGGNMKYVRRLPAGSGQSSHLILLAALTAISSVSPISLSTAQAQTAPDRNAEYDFDLPAQSLSQSVTDIVRTARMQVLYQGDGSRDVSAPALRGRMTVDQALARVLSGTGYTFQYTQPGVVTLMSSAAGGVDGERVLGAVRVEGSQGGAYGLAGATAVYGINGSRDVTATEGTGSYTTNAMSIGSKIPTSIKDMPAAVSVLTNQQLKDQNINDFNTAIGQMPGVFVDVGDSNIQPRFYSRGFEINTYQIDGGAGFRMTDYRQTSIDLAMYDHVELIRGADGMANFYGSPSGVINLVRKKPLDHGQVLVEGEVGSWDKYRAQFDVTGPLTSDGRLRGRAVSAYQQNNFFYDNAYDRKNIIYATVEYDLTPKTLMTIGVNHQQEEKVFVRGGMPRFTDGTDTMLPRSTCFCLPSGVNTFKSTDIFAKLERNFSKNWNFKLSFTRSNQNATQAAQIWLWRAPDNVPNPKVLVRYLGEQFSHDNQSALEATLDGRFRIFGNEQKVLLGANMLWSRGYNPAGGGELPPNTPGTLFNTIIPVPMYNFSAQDVPPVLGYTNDITDNSFDENNISGIYLNIDLQPVKGLHVLSSFRYSRTSSDNYRGEICRYPDLIEFCRARAENSPVPIQNIDSIGYGDLIYSDDANKYVGTDFAWPPSVMVRYDVTKSLSVYGNYTDIYVNNDALLDINLKRGLPPTRGANREIGVKWSPFGGRLNIVTSLYSNLQKNFPVGVPEDQLPVNVGQLPDYQSCCSYNNLKTRRISKGYDFEISGSPIDGLNLNASFSYTETKAYEETGNLNNSPGGLLGTLGVYKMPVVFKSFATYSVKNASVGFGLSGRGAVQASGTYCAELADQLDRFGNLVCNRNVAVNYRIPAYAVISLLGSYKINNNYSLIINIGNIFDKTYYVRTDGLFSNIYGEPRSVNLSIRAKY